MSNLPREFLSGLMERLPFVATRLHVQFIASTESPIEATFATAFILQARMLGYPAALVKSGYEAAVLLDQDWVTIRPQVEIDRFRVDFLVAAPRDSSIKPIVVECDGCEFHASTKELIERDRKRDEELAALGYEVVRFSGQRIHQDAFSCAARVFDKIRPELRGEFL